VLFARLGWLSRQLLSAHTVNILYRIVLFLLPHGAMLQPTAVYASRPIARDLPGRHKQVLVCDVTVQSGHWLFYVKTAKRRIMKTITQKP